MSSAKKPARKPGRKDRRVYVSLASDRSLQSYKDSINGLLEAMRALGADVEDDDMTDEEWEESWRAFWADAPPPPQVDRRKRKRRA